MTEAHDSDERETEGLVIKIRADSDRDRDGSLLPAGASPQSSDGQEAVTWDKPIITLEGV